MGTKKEVVEALHNNDFQEAAKLISSYEGGVAICDMFARQFAEKVISAGRLDQKSKAEELLERKFTADEMQKLEANGEVADTMHS